MLTSSQKVMTMAGPIFIHTHLIISIDTSETDLFGDILRRLYGTHHMIVFSWSSFQFQYLPGYNT